MKDNYIEALYKFSINYEYLWTVTVVHTDGSSPRKIGAQMIVGSRGELLWGTIGGGVIERKACLTTVDLVGSQLISYDVGTEESAEELDSTGMICGGTMTLYYHPHGHKFNPRAWIFGAGHCGKALYELLDTLNWDIIVLDNRPEVLNENDFPNAERRIGPYEEHVKKAEIKEDDYVLIMTYGHKWDYTVIKECVKKQWKYLGMMGSEKKVGTVFEKLREEEVPEEIIKKINAPIGLHNIGETPEEIAIDISSKLLTVHYQKEN
ncbi:MAG: XdhC family protein [Candidatus Hodarchaeales archaeon]